MRRYWWLAGLFSLASISAFSQNAAFNGFCTQGGKSTTTQGISSTNKAQIIIPSCTVTVFFTGTTTPVPSIFKDASGTPLTNPFTADNINAIAPGKWLFYAASGPAYDVVMSGGIAPLTFTAPVTLTGLQVGGGGGGAGVTTVACDPAMGNLLGCTVSNPATTPVFHWSTNNQASHTVYGNFSGTSGPPFFANYTCTGLLTCAFTSGSNTINFNVPNTSALSITTTLPIQVNGGAGPVASGTANISCPQCGSLQMTLVPPIAGQFALVPATASSIVYTGPGSTLNPSTVTNTSANVTVTQYPNAFPPSSADAILTNFTLPSFINPANVTAIYLVGFSSCTIGPFGASYAVAVNGVNTFGCGGNSALTQFSFLTTLTGSTIAASTVDALVSRSQPTNPGAMNIPLIEYMVFYTGTPPPAPSSGVNVLPPLYYTSDGNALGITIPFDVGTDIGAANAYNVNTPNYANWQVGTEIKFVPLHANTGASTIRFSTTQPTGLFSLVKAGGTPLAAGDIVTSVPAIVLFTNSGSAVVELENPQTGGGGGGSGITALTADVTATGPGNAAATVKGLNGVPFCTGFTPTNGQGVQYTTGSSPNPCYTAATSSGSIPNTTQILAGNGSGAAVSTAMDDGHTTASTITSTEPIAVVVAGGQGGTVDLTEGTAPSATSGHDILYADSAAHCIKNANNGGSFACLGAGGGGGGYTNVTGSIAETTVALINTSCGSGTYYATTALSIATGGTLTCPVQFSKSGVWTIASGQTVTFAGRVTETDAPSKHFAGLGSVVLVAQDAAVEWFGAVGYTAQAAAISGTDSLASINTCFSSLTSGQCKLQALWYRTTAAMTVANPGVGLAGASAGGVIGNLGTGATPSAIVLTSASADILDVGSLTAFIYNNAFNDFSLFRSAFGTGTAAGMRVIKCASCLITRTYSNDSIYNYYLEGLPAYGTGGIFSNGSQWGYNGLTPSGTVHGFFIDTTVPAQSMQMNYNIAANATSILTTATGFECNGAGSGCVDIMGVGNQTAQIGTGVSVTGASDFHWTDSIDDQDNTCISISGASSANFAGGWCFTNATAAVAISSSNNVSVTGKQLRTGGGGAPNLVTVSGSAGTIIANNHFFANSGANMLVETGSTAGVIAYNVMNFTNTGDCISLASGSNNNAITGNTCIANQSVTGIAFAGSSNNTLYGNVIQLSASGSTIGISADSSSNNNQYINFNNVQQAATLISDSGTGNQFTGGTTLDANTVNTPLYVAGGGTANAQTVTLSPSVATQSAGLHVRWIPTAANTSSTTLAVNGLTAKNLTKCGTTALTAGDLATLTIAEATYDGTQYQLLNPQAVACTPSSGSGISGATSGQALIAGSATTATSSKALAGSGGGLTTGPTSSTNLDCAQFTGTSGQIADSGAPCGGGSSGAMTNITGTVTVANCTLINSSSACQVQGSPVGSITFSSIPGTYNDLQLRCTYAAGSDVLQAVINADSTSGDYGIESMEANAAAAGTVFAATGGITFWPMAETANTTSWATAFVADFGGYANTTFFKNYHSSASALTNNGAVTQMISWVFAGVWTNTAAITSIKLAPSASNIKVGSQCSLYGIL